MNTVQFRSVLSSRLDDWRAQGLERNPAAFGTDQDPESVIDGEARMLFSSSNYLGLASHPTVRAAAHTALDRYGAGSGGSRLTTGTTDLHRELEAEIADWLGYPRCVYLSTGYQANLATLSVLGDSRDEPVTVFSDERNHASIIDGIRFARSTGAHLQVYPHRDLSTLRTQLQERPTTHALVVTDGVFSMDGTIAPVDELVALCREQDALLVVDDAHGIGTLAVDGSGCAASAHPDVLVGTASKALGSEGGFICCDEVVADLVTNQARPYVFSTSNAAPVIAATLAAVRLVRGQDRSVRNLRSNITHLCRRLEDAGIVAPSSGVGTTPIIPVPVGDEAAAMAVSAQLRDAGFHVPAIRYPTVPRGAAILRVTVMATHTRGQLDALADALISLR
ncbi:MAG TPA: 8-amino-7-oxononanoate synthase [Candidatus Corynebacterium avicola]|uniref:8-amino-7-oxononanoate synthase n=1 Tax=Candidatus Corynebacterium avicola TaxID=2838527 RepID=A0A9D1UL52_9CORY|nr:8-amino-7-oxononanoate synthase [Candidatus Corynebacterium avicola]